MAIPVVNIQDVSEATLSGLIGAAETETLDFKRDTYGAAEASRRELCKDVSALANTRGGDLLIGVAERASVAVDVPGIGVPDVHAEIQRLQNIIAMSLEPPIFGVQFHPVPVSAGRHVVIIRVPRSMDLPHRVTHSGVNRFYIRRSTDAVEASLLELRRMFELAGSEFENAERFREDRARQFLGNREPCQLSGKESGYYALHIVPFGYSHRSAALDLSHLYDGSEWLKFQPVGTHSANRLYCADGFLVRRAGDQCLGYTLVTRGGAVEATAANLFMTYKPNDQTLVNAVALRNEVRDAVAAYLAGLIKLGASGPWIVCLTLFNCQYSQIVVPTQSAWDRERLAAGLPIANTPFVLPSALLEHKHSAPDEVAEALRPVFDALWQAAGKARMGAE